MRPCPLCSCAASSRYLASSAWNNANGIELRKCGGCGFVFSAECAYSYENLFVHSLEAIDRDGLLDVARAQGLDRLVEEIARVAQLAPSARVLDFGSGVGLATLSFLQRGFDVTAVEESRRYIDAHRALGVRSFRLLEEAAQSGGPFDLVIAKDVLEHLADPRAMLAALVKCVKPGGHMYIRVPNVIAYRFHWSVDTISHVSHFTPRLLIRLAAETGLGDPRFIGVYDVSSRAGRLYNAVFWQLKSVLPLYHQISLLLKKERDQ